MDAAQLSPTGRVILGMIALGRRTGYEIKQLVDRSTRHFWAASYGQIYPELRRLEEGGLIKGRLEGSGGRTKITYELTPEGSAALHDWLSSDAPLVFEMRNEGMLKLFFSDVAPETKLAQIRAMRSHYERQRAELHAIGKDPSEMTTGPGMTLDLGLGLVEWLIEWCLKAEDRLATAATGGVKA